MTINWLKCVGEQWCPLLTLNLPHSHFDGLEGVYIIWHGQPDPAVVCVGQGNIRDQLTQHRNDSAVLAYKDRELFVTWARVDSKSRNGIHRFLCETWKPKIKCNAILDEPISVNSPWAK